jgi:methionine-rich copper-binding protein CopC
LGEAVTRRTTWGPVSRAILLGSLLAVSFLGLPAAAKPANTALRPHDAVLPTTGGVLFFDLPCRALDTRRVGNGLPAAVEFDFDPSACGVPAGVESMAVNVTVVSPPASGDLRIFPAGAAASSLPVVNFTAGVVRANNAVVQLSSGGSVGLLVDMPSDPTGKVQVLVDIQGYFDTPPVVSATVPVDGATGVSTIDPLSVTFSKPVNPTASAFTLECPSGTPVSITTTPAGPASTFNVVPNKPLPAGTTCVLDIVADQITDPAGEPLQVDQSVTFTTDEAPTVTGTTPVSGATDVALTSTVQFTFNEAVNVTATAFRLECPSGTPVSFAVSPAPPGNATTFTLTPSANLPAGTVCTATAVASQITDALGTPLASDDAISFTTDTAPTVTSTIPLSGATNVTPSAGISITFSKAVNVTATAFTLQCPGGTPEAFTLFPGAPGGATSFTLNPSASLPQDTTCAVTAVASQVTDTAAGTNLASNFVFSFTTGSAPTVTSTVPANGAVDVPLSATLTINFSQTVNATASAFSLACASSPWSFTVAPPLPGSGSVFVLTPSPALPAGASCTVTVSASQITDASTSLPMAANYAFSFSVDALPQIVSTVPVNGQNPVALSVAPSFTFSKAVTDTDPGFTLSCNGTPIAFTVSPTPPGPALTFTLTPTSTLPVGQACVARALATQIADAAGSHLAADVVVSFTTDSAPQVIGTTPPEGATSVPLTSPVSVTFSVAVTAQATAFSVECPSGTAESISVSPVLPGTSTNFTLTPATSWPAGTTCTVTAHAAQIQDSLGTSPASDFTLHFATDVAPTVTTTSPANLSTNVAPSTPISITFSESVEVSTGSAFGLQCNSAPVTFTVAPTPPSSAPVFTLTPSADLPSASSCTVTVAAADITDPSGTPLAADYSFTFTTGTPPAVTSTAPADGAANVLATAPISINFSETVNVAPNAFSIQCPTGNPVAFVLNPAPPGDVASFTLTPSSALPSGTTCTVTAVAADIADATSGVQMKQDFSFAFTTDTPPTVASVSPSNGSTGVSPATTVVWTFDKAVNINANSFTLQCPSGTPLPFMTAPTPPGGATTYTLTPSPILPTGTTCVAVAVASQITDLVGTHLASNQTDSFTTDVAPTVTSTSPANGATTVLANTTISVTFSKAVNVTATAFTLQCPTGTPESFSLSPAPPGSATSFTLTPSATLPAGAVCTVVVVASQVTDTAAGTHLAANDTFSFTIDTPPTVALTAPANGFSVFVDTNPISFTFSKAVNVTGTAFNIQCPVGTAVAFTLSPAPPGAATTFTLTPLSHLPPDTTCSATASASQIADLAGTHLASDDTIEFATIAPPPVATADTYPQTVVGNVNVISAAIPFSVTANDTSQVAFTVTAFDATSANGGTVSVTTSGANMGQFTYNPPAGFRGADSFTYTITNATGGGHATATVSISVNGMVWFVNNGGSSGDGRLQTPFSSLSAFAAINDAVGRHPQANDVVFLYDTGTNYTGPLTLLNGQFLVGQDATSSLSAITGITPPTGSAALPATGHSIGLVVTSSGNTVTLGSGNTVWGLTLGNASGIALTGSSVGSLKIRDLTINNTVGSAVSLASGALDAILQAVSSGGGIHGISLTTTTGSFDVEGGGSSDPTNTTQGRTTAKNGGGTLVLGSGGTVSAATSSGVLLSSATNVTLRNMVVQNNGGTAVNSGGDGIKVTNGSNLTLDNALVQGQTTNNGLHASSLAGFAIQHSEFTNNASSASADGTHVWDVRIDDGTGTSTVANSFLHNTREDLLGIEETGSSTLTLTVTNSKFTDTATAAPGNDGIEIELQNSASCICSVTGSTFNNIFSVGAEYLGEDSSSGSFTVKTSSFDNDASDIVFAHQGLGKTASFDIENNLERQNSTANLSGAIAITLGAESNVTTLVQGKIENNLIGKALVDHSGSQQGSGIVLTGEGSGTLTALVNGNSVVQVDNEGLNVTNGGGSAVTNVIVENNSFNVDQASGNSDFGMLIVDGAASGDTSVMCLKVDTNHSTGNATNGGNGIGLATEGGTPTLGLQGYSGSANNSTQIASFLDGNNTDAPAALVLTGAGTIKAASANCPTPP